MYKHLKILLPLCITEVVNVLTFWRCRQNTYCDESSDSLSCSPWTTNIAIHGTYCAIRTISTNSSRILLCQDGRRKVLRNAGNLPQYYTVSQTQKNLNSIFTAVKASKLAALTNSGANILKNSCLDNSDVTWDIKDVITFSAGLNSRAV